MKTTSNLPWTSSPLREAFAFLAITYGLAVALAVGLPDAGINVPLTALFPTVAVTIMTFTTFRRGSRRELWRSVGLDRAGLRSWGPALGLPILVCGAAFGSALLMGVGQVRALHLTGSTVSSFAFNTVMNLLVGLIILVGEEIGWRGFMLPRIQQLTTRRRAAVVIGFAHGCFHLPLILIATTYDTDGSRWVAAPVAVLTITAAGVFYAWLRDRSGSVWPAAIGHTFANLTFSWGFAALASTTPAALAFVAGETGVATLAAVVALAVVLLATAKVWKTPAIDRREVLEEADATAVHLRRSRHLTTTPSD